MADLKVTCATRSIEKVEHITRIGGQGFNITVAEAVRRINSGQDRFYTQTGSTVAYLRVVTRAAGEPYVRTTPDNTLADNLLSLAQCP